MKAKNLSGKSPGGKRSELADALPLSTPYIVQIFPIYACNFKCNYCIFYVDKKKRHFVSSQNIMKLEVLEKCVDEMKRFPEKIKVLRFVGIGEPLMHKKLVEMIEYAVDSKVANNVELLTNASILSNELSDRIIESRLDRLVISLQGIDATGYKDVADVDVDFEEFIRNIQYFYENKTNTHVYIKIIDQVLSEDGDEQHFYDLFGDICDSIAVENLVPIHEVEYGDDVLDVDETQFGQPLEKVRICPQPFFTIQINPDGNVVPCHSFKYPAIVGNVNDESFYDIWRKDCFDEFRYNMLENGVSEMGDTCKNCTIYKYRIFQEDILDGKEEKLKPLFLTN
jgi:radical SAM protein with 4Fe4S-binding SPASM domain